MENFILLWVEFINPPKSLKLWFLSMKYFYPEIFYLDGSLWVKTKIYYSLSLDSVNRFCLESDGWQGLTYCFHLETGDFDPDFGSMRENIEYKQVKNHKIKISGIKPGNWFEIEGKLYKLNRLEEYIYSLSLDRCTHNL
jgi:hypothetical protein